MIYLIKKETQNTYCATNIMKPFACLHRLIPTLPHPPFGHFLPRGREIEIDFNLERGSNPSSQIAIENS